MQLEFALLTELLLAFFILCQTMLRDTKRI